MVMVMAMVMAMAMRMRIEHTDLSKYARVQPCLFKELDRNLARHHSHALGVGLAEKQPVYPLLFGGQVKVRRAWERGSMQLADTVVTSFTTSKQYRQQTAWGKSMAA